MKKPKKIDSIDDMLLSGKFTIRQIAAEVVKLFKVKPQTALNTTRWAKSTIKQRTGQEAIVKLEPRLKKNVKFTVPINHK